MPTAPNPAALVNAGQLDDAIAASISEVKQHPTNLLKRSYLAELLCVRGDLERADGHLETLMMQDPKAAVSVALLRQLIRAETARRECWQSGRPPELLEEASEQVRLQLKLMLSLREENFSQATEINEKLIELRPALSGNSEGTAFSSFRDLDDVWQSTLEVLTSTGKYYWIPTDRIILLEVTAPKSPCDLIWPQAHLIVQNGPEGQVYLPALYPKTAASEDIALKMGRATEWDESIKSLVQGVGLRTFWIDSEEKPIYELTEITINQVEEK